MKGYLSYIQLDDSQLYQICLSCLISTLAGHKSNAMHLPQLQTQHQQYPANRSGQNQPDIIAPPVVPHQPTRRDRSNMQFLPASCFADWSDFFISWFCGKNMIKIMKHRRYVLPDLQSYYNGCCYSRDQDFCDWHTWPGSSSKMALQPACCRFMTTT